jgi:hypothetical protein
MQTFFLLWVELAQLLAIHHIWYRQYDGVCLSETSSLIFEHTLLLVRKFLCDVHADPHNSPTNGCCVTFSIGHLLTKSLRTMRNEIIENHNEKKVVSIQRIVDFLSSVRSWTSDVLLDGVAAFISGSWDIKSLKIERGIKYGDDWLRMHAHISVATRTKELDYNHVWSLSHPSYSFHSPMLLYEPMSPTLFDVLKLVLDGESVLSLCFHIFTNNFLDGR